MNSRSTQVRVAVSALCSGAALLVLATVPVAAGAAEAAPVPEPARHHFSLKGAGETYQRKDEVSEVKLDSIRSDGRFSILDEYWHPGFKVVPHFHQEHAEVCYVIAGQVEWTVGGETHLMGAGSMVYIPPDTVHSVKVVGNKDYHGLMIYQPGGYERNIISEQQYSLEQQEQPEIKKKLREQGDFNPVPSR